MHAPMPPPKSAPDKYVQAVTGFCAGVNKLKHWKPTKGTLANGADFFRLDFMLLIIYSAVDACHAPNHPVVQINCPKKETQKW